MNVRYDTYCGLNCSACPVGMANQQEDEKLIREMANDWDRNPEDLRCDGCKTSVNASFCTDCQIRRCARKRGVEFCIECEIFPCEIITQFRNDDASHHSVIFRNLELIRKLGVKTWLDTEEKRWSCKECGSRFNWYTETCDDCGTSLYNAVSEEKHLEV
ncbi:MAG: DUF3795 domain-containing protein [Candidatus Aegiribacteria sp.]|nr:DUF3795 domain-containing protein [Candidatus Aegiribacteria sp.]